MTLTRYKYRPAGLLDKDRSYRRKQWKVLTLFSALWDESEWVLTEPVPMVLGHAKKISRQGGPTRTPVLSRHHTTSMTLCVTGYGSEVR